MTSTVRIYSIWMPLTTSLGTVQYCIVPTYLGKTWPSAQARWDLQGSAYLGYFVCHMALRKASSGAHYPRAARQDALEPGKKQRMRMPYQCQVSSTTLGKDLLVDQPICGTVCSERWFSRGYGRSRMWCWDVGRSAPSSYTMGGLALGARREKETTTQSR